MNLFSIYLGSILASLTLSGSSVSLEATVDTMWNMVNQGFTIQFGNYHLTADAYLLYNGSQYGHTSQLTIILGCIGTLMLAVILACVIYKLKKVNNPGFEKAEKDGPPKLQVHICVSKLYYVNYNRSHPLDLDIFWEGFQ